VRLGGGLRRPSYFFYGEKRREGGGEEGFCARGAVLSFETGKGNILQLKRSERLSLDKGIKTGYPILWGARLAIFKREKKPFKYLG